MQMKKMEQKEFEVFQQYTTSEYAQMFATEHDVPMEKALEAAKRDVTNYLPEGKNTKDHYFFDLISDQKSCGYLWFGVREQTGTKKIFIFDILVHESARGKGCGKFMLAWLESEAKLMGLNEIYLHVFAKNTVARGLYESTGFQVTNLYMAKKF